jgi:exonuclease I
MQPLVTLALNFIAENLQEIILLPIDMSCINQNLVMELAAIVDITVLESLNDKKDKLKSKIYMKKLEV